MLSRLHLDRWQATTAVFLFLMLVTGSAFAADPTALFPPLNEVMAKGLGHKLPRVKIDQDLPPAMVFAVPVPSKDWQRLPPDNATINPIQLAAFAAPQGPAAGLVEVLATDLRQEVGKADWLKALMRANGFDVMEDRLALSASGIAFEALGKKQDPKQGEILLRAGVWRSGTVLFTVWCSAKRDAFTKLARDYAVCLAGFKLADPQPVKQVGNWAKHCIANVLCYTGPAEKPQERNAPDYKVLEQVFQLKQGDQLTGSLQVAVILPPEAERKSPEERLKTLQKYLAVNGPKVEFEARGAKVRHQSIKGDAYYIHGIGKKGDAQVELYAVAMQNTMFSAMVWAQTVGPETNLEAWMHNKRVFQLVSKSLEVKKVGRIKP